MAIPSKESCPFTNAQAGGPTAEAETDYSLYMQTTALLSLQRRPEEMLHRDELLFQTVHQTTELWLKHAGFELDEAIERLSQSRLEGCGEFIHRAACGLRVLTAGLEMFHHLTPRDFHVVRGALGNGSGLESPGWRGLHRAGRRLREAFGRLLVEREIALLDLYRTGEPVAVYRLAESLVELDEANILWRARHFTVAIRIIGDNVTGTKGKPVNELFSSIGHRMFPDLWAARTELTQQTSGEYGGSTS